MMMMMMNVIIFITFHLNDQKKKERHFRLTVNVGKYTGITKMILIFIIHRKDQEKEE